MITIKRGQRRAKRKSSLSEFVSLLKRHFVKAGTKHQSGIYSFDEHAAINLDESSVKYIKDGSRIVFSDGGNREDKNISRIS